jgi:hypothetical protein
MVVWIAVIDDDEPHVSVRRRKVYDKPKAVLFHPENTILLVPTLGFAHGQGPRVVSENVRSLVTGAAPSLRSEAAARISLQMDQKGGRQQVAIHPLGDQAVFDRIFVAQFAHQERAHDRQQKVECDTAERCRLPAGSYVVWLIAATEVFLRECLSVGIAGPINDSGCLALRLLGDHRLRQLRRAGLIDAVVCAAEEQTFRYGWR